MAALQRRLIQLFHGYGVSPQRTTVRRGPHSIFICLGGINPPGIKVFSPKKRLYGAKAPPRCAGPL
jgi:hypothetical protein